MEQILGRISDKTTSPKGSFGSLFADRIKEVREAYKGNERLIDEKIKQISVLRWKINQHKNDFEQQILLLANGKITEFNELKKTSVRTYLIKMDEYVSQIEAMDRK